VVVSVQDGYLHLAPLVAVMAVADTAVGVGVVTTGVTLHPSETVVNIIRSVVRGSVISLAMRGVEVMVTPYTPNDAAAAKIQSVLNREGAIAMLGVSRG
jgi:Na+-translocating ferredoxin:NAD+ oxidoreductase RnfE subunit